MTNAHYRSSLRGAGLFIYLFLFRLFPGIGVSIFLFSRISIQMIILDHLQKHQNNPVSIDISPSGAVVLMESKYEHEYLPDLIALARQVEEAVK